MTVNPFPCAVMYICVCNAVSDRDIRRAVDAGVRDFPALQARTGCSTCCGCCEALARQVLEEAVAGAAPALLPTPVAA